MPNPRCEDPVHADVLNVCPACSTTTQFTVFAFSIVDAIPPYTVEFGVDNRTSVICPAKDVLHAQCEAIQRIPCTNSHVLTKILWSMRVLQVYILKDSNKGGWSASRGCWLRVTLCANRVPVHFVGVVPRQATTPVIQ